MTKRTPGVYRVGKNRYLVQWSDKSGRHRKWLPPGATLTDAKDERKKKVGEAAAGKLAALPGRFTYDALLKLLGDPPPVSRALREAWPGTMLARELDAAKIAAFERDRLAAGRARATVNNDLAALRHACRLAVRAKRLAEAPYIATPDPHNARKGFFEPETLAKVLAKLPAWAQAPVEFMALTGWRSRSEVITLAWKTNVDWRAQVVRLEPGTTKNGEGREFPFDVYPALKALLERQLAAAEPVSAATVFFQANGEPIPYKLLRQAWRAACRKAGLAGKLMHDLRRSAVRNLERKGVSRSVAMSLTGHKTEAVYRRYAIVDSAAQREGVAKLAAVEPQGTGE